MNVFFLFLIFLTANAQALSPLKEAEDRREVASAAIREAVFSKESSQRKAVARALGRIQKPEGIDFLLTLLNDKDVIVQREAAFALGQLGWDSRFAGGREVEITQALGERLSTSNVSLRATLVEAIGKVALGETPKWIISFLSDKSARVRKEAVVALYRYRVVLRMRGVTEIPLLGDEAMTKLLSLVEDKNEELRQSVAYYFQRISDERGKDAAIKLSSSKELWTRYFALSSLSRFKLDATIKQKILDACEDESANVRTVAVQIAKSFKLSSELSSLLAGDPSFHVRMAYAQALSEVSSVAAFESLKRLLSDSSLSVRAEALKGLATFNSDEARSLVLKHTQDASWVLRSASVHSLASFDFNERMQILKNAFNDTDVRVRVAALEVLAEIDDSLAYTLIKQALNSDELSERSTAVVSLQARKEESRFADAQAVYSISLEEKWVELREEIVNLWASHVSDETTLYLRQALADPVRSVGNLAAKALVARGVSAFPNPSGTDVLSMSPYREKTFKRNPKLHLQTTKGLVSVELFHRQAPLHVANIVGYALDKKYNGLPIHRVVSNFVIQGGDPDKSGWGSAGYSMRAEINPLHFERGSLGMPRSAGFDTGGVQFFINHLPTPNLDGLYTIFGRVVEGLDVLDRTEVGDLILDTSVEL